MALFGYAHAQENDAERAVRAALAIQHALGEINAKNVGKGRRSSSRASASSRGGGRSECSDGNPRTAATANRNQAAEVTQTVPMRRSWRRLRPGWRGWKVPRSTGDGRKPSSFASLATPVRSVVAKAARILKHLRLDGRIEASSVS
jgi:hypothetical protein